MLLMLTEILFDYEKIKKNKWKMVYKPTSEDPVLLNSNLIKYCDSHTDDVGKKYTYIFYEKFDKFTDEEENCILFVRESLEQIMDMQKKGR